MLAFQVFVRAQGQGYPVRVIQQFATNQAWHVVRVFDLFTQGSQYRLKVQQLHRIPAVHHG